MLLNECHWRFIVKSAILWSLLTVADVAGLCCLKQSKLDGVKQLLQLWLDFDSASIQLRQKMNMFIFCGVKRLRSQ